MGCSFRVGVLAAAVALPAAAMADPTPYMTGWQTQAPVVTVGYCGTTISNGNTVGLPCAPGMAPSDPNNAAFSFWPAYAVNQTYSAAQLAGVRSVEMNLTAAGTVTFVDLAGNSMALPYPASGVYQLPIVPASISLSGGAAATFWMLK